MIQIKYQKVDEILCATIVIFYHVMFIKRLLIGRMACHSLKYLQEMTLERISAEETSSQYLSENALVKIDVNPT